MRGVKAEGGWACVSTEEVEISSSSDLSPYIEGRIWDDSYIDYHRKTVEKIHQHSALAAIELTHGGLNCPNYTSREIPLGPTNRSVIGGTGFEPVIARMADKDDLKSIREDHKKAVKRAVKGKNTFVVCIVYYIISLYFCSFYALYYSHYFFFGFVNCLIFCRFYISAGYDMITIYSGHGLSLALQFMMKRYNTDRTDEYSYSTIENRTR